VIVLQLPGGSVFTDILAGMRLGWCDVSLPDFYRHPYREAVADFLCPIYTADTWTFTRLGDTPQPPLADLGTGAGLSICADTGSTQALLAAKVFPEATIIPTPQGEYYAQLCAGNCDVVDATSQAAQFFASEPACVGHTPQFDILPITGTPGGDVAAFTLRNGRKRDVFSGHWPN